MRNMPGQKILPRIRAIDASPKKDAANDQASDRTSQLCVSRQSRIARAIARSMARDVGAAKIGNHAKGRRATACLGISFHQSSHHLDRLPAHPSRLRIKILTALVSRRRALFHPPSVATSSSVGGNHRAGLSQTSNTSSLLVPMNAQEIRGRMQNGFRRFTLHLTDGQHFSVPHPDFIAVGKNVVVIIDENDVSRTIDALHIVSIEEAADQ
jgi:hypothetical protein